MSYKISPYRYQNGYSCFALHTGERPTKENILMESSKRETLEKRLESMQCNLSS